MAKILIIDDSPAMRKMIEHTLKGAGHLVTVAVDGKDGLKKAKLDSFEVIFTDINMPNMDGIELVKQLRARSSYKSVPIVILTTESDSNMKRKGKEAGATGWIIKPFNPERLLATVGRVLG